MSWLNWHHIPDVVGARYEKSLPSIEIVLANVGSSQNNPFIRIVDNGNNIDFPLLAKLRQAIDDAFADQLAKLEVE